MSIKLTFLGGAGTVTGSKFLLEGAGRRLLIDCGLFQGFKNLRLRNWAPPPIDPHGIDAVILTHAHLDHSGYLPLLVKHGFGGKVYCTSGTRDLCGVLLPDSGHLQEQDAEYANRHGFSKHHPAQPLYTRKDAIQSLSHMSPVDFAQEFAPAEGIAGEFQPAGHILGAAVVTCRLDGHSVVFSGDLGRPNEPIMVPPAAIKRADYLVVESTYGNRLHDRISPMDLLANVVGATIGRGGTVLVPAFAVGRAQSLLYYLERLKVERRIPDVPVFLDSPMAINASEIFCKHVADHRLTDAQCRAACSVATYLRTSDESKALNSNHVPSIIISASGMATGGRVLHHLKRLAPDPRNTILFTGYQAGGTRGAALVGGAQQVKIHGQQIPVHADVRDMPMLSAHADANEILGWLRQFEVAPRMTFITHGEPSASDALRLRIQDELGWPCLVPDHRDVIQLT